VQRKQAYPPGGMDRVLVRVRASLGDFVGYVVNCYNAVEQHDNDEKQKKEREVIEEWVSHG
jgi:hypothetical protein